MKFEKSNMLYKRAQKVTPNGTHSWARNYALIGRYEGRPEFPKINYPKFTQKAQGAYIYDCDGNRFIDYMLALGPVILGHSNPRISEAVKNQLDNGVIFGTCHEKEIEVSEKIVKHVPCANKVSILSTGSEATLAALRISRAYTAKEKVVKFDGHYHSWHDWHKFGSLQAGHLYTGGIPRSIEDDYLILPWNDPKKLKILTKLGDEVAAVICEAVVGNCGCILPEEGYLEELREICSDRDVVLIFDEVVTGFRLGLGGVQEKLGVVPDLAVFGKAMANGFPIAAVAGREEIMMTENVALGGTFNSNPISCSAALATIEELEDSRKYEKMNKLGSMLMKGIEDAISDVEAQAIVQGYAELFSIIFTDQDEVRSPNQLFSIEFYPHVMREAAFYQEMLDGGILNVARRGNRWVLSTAHEKDDIEKTIEVSYKALKAANKIS